MLSQTLATPGFRKFRGQQDSPRKGKKGNLLGLGISAVAFPFLGLIAMMLYGADIHLFLRRIGKWPAFILLFILQMSQGPVGSMPRLVTLMHANIKPYLPDLTLSYFSILICAIVFLVALRPQRIVDLLGIILTPLLLGTLAVLIYVGMTHAPQAQVVSESSTYFFTHGLKMGYQTTDLIAALLFATLILPHQSHGTEHLPPEEAKRQIQAKMTLASLIAAGLLMVTYIGLCLLSAHHSWTLSGVVAPEELLHRIATQILGPVGGLIAALAIFLACLTTIISLAAVFSSYLQKDLFFNKAKPLIPLALTLVITGAMANLGFSGIVRLWGPILNVLYPSLIVLCLFNIAHRLYQVKPIQVPVFFTLGFALGGFFFG